MTIRHDAQIPTYSYLPDRDPRGFISTGGSLPPWFFDSDDFFFIFGPCGFYLDSGFSKVLGDVFIRKIFPYYPCGFSDIIVVHLAPVGFIQPVVFKK